MIDLLYRLDLFLLHTLNVNWAHPSLDIFWLTITNMHKQIWFKVGLAPVLVASAVYIYRMGALKIATGIFLGVLLADTLAYRVIKSQVERPRPFQNSEISWLRKVGQAHGSSFPSNHAANIFAAAVILSWFIPRGAYVFYAFALLIALSRVALGVHYPSDALAGAILGLSVGGMVRIFVLRRIKWFRLRENVSTLDAVSSDQSSISRRPV